MPSRIGDIQRSRQKPRSMRTPSFSDAGDALLGSAEQALGAIGDSLKAKEARQAKAQEQEMGMQYENRLHHFNMRHEENKQLAQRGEYEYEKDAAYIDFFSKLSPDDPRFHRLNNSAQLNAYALKNVNDRFIQGRIDEEHTTSIQRGVRETVDSADSIGQEMARNPEVGAFQLGIAIDQLGMLLSETTSDGKRIIDEDDQVLKGFTNQVIVSRDYALFLDMDHDSWQKAKVSIIEGDREFYGEDTYGDRLTPQQRNSFIDLVDKAFAERAAELDNRLLSAPIDAVRAASAQDNVWDNVALKAVGIADGDSLILSDKYGNKSYGRLLFSDSPERGHPGGGAASDRAQKFFDRGDLHIIPLGAPDVYGRQLIGAVGVHPETGEQELLSHYMVEEGAAVPWDSNRAVSAPWMEGLGPAIQHQRAEEGATSIVKGPTYPTVKFDLTDEQVRERSADLWEDKGAPTEFITFEQYKADNPYHPPSELREKWEEGRALFEEAKMDRFLRKEIATANASRLTELANSITLGKGPEERALILKKFKELVGERDTAIEELGPMNYILSTDPVLAQFIDTATNAGDIEQVTDAFRLVRARAETLTGEVLGHLQQVTQQLDDAVASGEAGAVFDVWRKFYDGVFESGAAADIFSRDMSKHDLGHIYIATEADESVKGYLVDKNLMTWRPKGEDDVAQWDKDVTRAVGSNVLGFFQGFPGYSDTAQDLEALYESVQQVTRGLLRDNPGQSPTRAASIALDLITKHEYDSIPVSSDSSVHVTKEALKASGLSKDELDHLKRSISFSLDAVREDPYIIRRLSHRTDEGFGSAEAYLASWEINIIEQHGVPQVLITEKPDGAFFSQAVPMSVVSQDGTIQYEARPLMIPFRVFYDRYLADATPIESQTSFGSPGNPYSVGGARTEGYEFPQQATDIGIFNIPNLPSDGPQYPEAVPVPNFDLSPPDRVTDGALTDSDLIRKEEGSRLEVYADTEGHPTVGIGHKVTPEDGLKVGDTITPQKRDELFSMDFATALEGTGRVIPSFPEHPEEVQELLVSMTFQMGATGLSRFEKMIEALEAKDYVKAAEEMLDSKWARQTPLRAKRAAAIMRAAAGR